VGEPLVQRNFAGGELARTAAMRADLALYLQALRTCRNFLILRHGGVSNRTGSRFLAEVKASSVRTWLLTFVFNASQTYVIEAGDQYFRFYKNGARIESPPGTPVEIATPYLAADLADLQWVQSADVVTITHRSYAPRELRRSSDIAWALTTITTAPSIDPPTGIGAGGFLPGTGTRAYVVTAVKPDTFEESIASSSIVLTLVADPTQANPIAVTFTPTPGAFEHRVYLDPYNNGHFGFIGRTSFAYFNDVGLLPDFTQTPPLARVLFTSAGNFPATAAHYQQRRMFANTVNAPETVEGSRIGFYSNFSISSPLQEDDAITFIIAGDQVQEVRFLIGLKRLVVLTASGEWKIMGDDSGALTPFAINPDQQGYAGVAFVRPIVIQNTIIFLQARAAKIRDLRFTQEVEGIGSKDLTLFASHLFDGKTFTRLAYAQEPHSIVYVVRNDGTLLALTYLPESDVFGWARFDTDGVYEDVAVVPEGTEDAVYVTVRRTIAGQTKRYVERFASRLITSYPSGAFFVDAGLAYSGAPASTFAGLAHLEGKTVSALADGVAYTGLVVSGGSVTLPAAASVVVIGLPITADLETLDLDVGGTGLRDTKKVVKSVTAILDQAVRGWSIGRDAAHLTVSKPELWQASGLVDGAVETVISSSWSDTGRVFLRHTSPEPLTVLGLIPNVTPGG